MSEDFFSNLIQDYAIYALGISTIIGSLIAIYKKAIKPMVKFLMDWFDTVEKIDRIFVELTPNDGTSIKDKIDRIEDKVGLFQQIQDAMAADTKAALFRTDSAGNCVWVNRTYTRTVGRDISEILGHGWQNVIASEDRDSVVKEWYKAVEENRDFALNYSFETSDGELIPCRCRGYKMVDYKGDTLGYYGNCTIL